MRFVFFLLSFSVCALTLKAQSKTATITTTEGSIKVLLFDDTPRHTQAFTDRASRGEFDGTLFTRVISEFMIQGGAPDSRNAPPGARCGFGDRSAEILPEFRAHHFHKKGALAAPRQNDDINPERKSDMSQFFIVQGKVYREGELDTLELATNQPFRRKAIAEFYTPVKEEMQKLKTEDPKEFNRRAAEITHQMDSVVRSSSGHLLFTPEQREAYTTTGGCHHLDGQYTIFGEVTEGMDIIDKIASQPKDSYDRPKKDIRIVSVTIR